MEHWENNSLISLSQYIDGDGLVNEVWVDVVGYEGYYAVSTFGRVKSYSRLVWQPQMNRYVRRKERILRQKVNIYGYLCVTLQVNKKKYETGVHIIVCRAFNINDNQERNQVNHKLGNKKDNRPSQLEWTTPKENSNHAIRIGIDSVVGEHNGRCILTEQQILEIRGQYEKNKKGYRKILSKKYGVSKSQIGKICLRNLWKHI